MYTVSSSAAPQNWTASNSEGMVTHRESLWSNLCADPPQAQAQRIGSGSPGEEMPLG